MQIIKDDRIFNKYFKDVSRTFKRKMEDINEIIIHGSGGSDTAKGIIKWMLDGGSLADGSNRIDDYKKGVSLFHFEIDDNGDIYEIVPIEYRCHHSSSGRHDKNTIGIELVQTGIDNKKKYSIYQYNSLFWLIKDIITKCPIEVIAGHSVTKQIYSGSYKDNPPCPGNFDWKMLEDNFNVTKIRNEIFKLNNKNA